MKAFMKSMAEWFMIRVVGGVAVTMAIMVLWFSFVFTKNLNFF